MRTSLMLAVPAVGSESRLVSIWMASGLTDWLSNFEGLEPTTVAYD